MTSTPPGGPDAGSHGGEFATYGEHAERAADALDALIRSDHLPYDLDQVEIVLGAREAVVDVLRDRMRDHLDFPVHVDDPYAYLPVTLTRLQQDPVRELGVSIMQLPRLPLEQRPSPVDVLDRRAATDPSAAAWVDAARELLAADHVLAGAQHQPWRSTDATGQAAHLALAADTAQVLEAVTVLDHRMEEVGLLADRLQHPAGIADRATVRLLASHLDRLGQQHGEHSSTDLAHIAPAIATEHREPIKLITAPGDLAAAQRQLTRFLAPMAERAGNHILLRDRITGVMANTIGVSQRELINQLHDRIAATPQLRNQLPRIERLRELHDDARHQLVGLHDAQQPRIHRWMRHQQQEISVAVKSGAVGRLSDQQVVDVLAATESAAGKWAKAILVEAERPKGRLRIMRRAPFSADHPARRKVVYGRIKAGGPAVQTLKALAAYAPAPEVTTNLLATQNRDQLRVGLARAVLTERPAHPRTPPGVPDPSHTR